ncbi:hypothetical protein T492DRAFT_492620 [Pavlovales sp. CCMP2436]|nr:hypothetical protein T492DRAFT_492620 [Pavlovales sp. CCMP2436]
MMPITRALHALDQAHAVADAGVVVILDAAVSETNRLPIAAPHIAAQLTYMRALARASKLKLAGEGALAELPAADPQTGGGAGSEVAGDGWLGAPAALEDAELALIADPKHSGALAAIGLAAVCAPLTDEVADQVLEIALKLQAAVESTRRRGVSASTAAAAQMASLEAFWPRLRAAFEPLVRI